MLTVSALHALLRTKGLRLHKRLGQHYLINAHVIQRVVEACQLTPQEDVVEIGAGLGALTEPLAAHARNILAYEIDRGIAPVLAERLRGLSNVTIRCQDIVEHDWTATPHAVVVGAIPYHITSEILVTLTEQRAAIARALLILQHEVVQRLIATPGTKAYGRLSLLIQYAWQVQQVFKVPKTSFFPVPEVDSACLSLQPHAIPPITLMNEGMFFNVVKAAFAHRRKTLANSLSESALNLTRIEANSLLRQAGISPTVRGEMLTLEEFARLANLVKVSDTSKAKSV